MITLQDYIEIQEAKRILSNPNYEIIDEGKVGRAIKKFFNWLFGSSKTNSHISKIDLDKYNVNDDGIIQLKLSDFIIEDELNFAQIQNTITDVDNNAKDDDSKKFHHIKEYIKDIKDHKYGIYENMVHGYTLRPNNQTNIAGLIIFSYADDLYNETYAENKNSSPRYKIEDDTSDGNRHEQYGHIWDVEIVPAFDNSKKDKENNLFKPLVNHVNSKLRNAGNEGVTTIANYSQAGKYWKENHGFKPYKSANKSYYEKEL